MSQIRRAGICEVSVAGKSNSIVIFTSRLGHANMSSLTSVSRPTSNLEPYIDASEAAQFLKIHPKTLLRMARDRAVPAYSFNDGARRHWRFLKSELDIWMRSRLNAVSHPVRSVS